MTDPIEKSDEQWRADLTPTQYCVLREEATEQAFTSPLNAEKREGRFVCAGCGQALFSSETKFDSGTGWPSFYSSLPGVFETREDHSHFMVRIEYHCSRCGSHHGHLFEDGPAPTGLRYCNNGVALRFEPQDDD